MARNLVICCDGTNNQFGPENTSIVRLVQILERDPVTQRLYYDPGVGTLPEPGMATAIGQKVSEWFGLAFGTGLTWKVEQAYSYLMDLWEPDDRVFLFGFSRGAYTVRVLAALLHALGILPRGNNNLVPYVMRLFKSVRKEGRPSPGSEESNYWKLCNQFRWTFARPVPGDDQRHFRVHFLGVWDTVSSVGWVWDPVKFPYTAHNPSIGTIRHAISLDERRAFYRQNTMGQTGIQDFQELWFPGVHADVGGGYPEKDSGLWRPPFHWILEAAQKAGLLVDPDRLKKVLNRTPPPEQPWKEPAHKSLTPLWWLAEFFPKLAWRPGSSIRWPRLGLGQRRTLEPSSLIHKSALMRIRGTDYAPPNLTDAFLAKVRELEVVPEWLAYEP